MVCDHTKIQGFWKKKKIFSHLRVSFFFTRIGSWPYQNSGYWKKNWKKILKKKLKKKILKIFENFFLNFFSHSRVSFFFTRIGLRLYQNSGVFGKNWKKNLKIYFDFFSHPRVSFFLPELFCDHTKIQGFWKRKKKNSHLRVSFFFTKIGSR